MAEFIPWPKTARLFRDIVVTEKIDGTNSAIHITEVDRHDEHQAYISDYDGYYQVAAQSRKRMITPGKTTDNYGFAGWVYDNAHTLVELLGVGVHFGEWWGQGIQRRYDMEEKRFSLFNTDRWSTLGFEDGDLIPIGEAVLSSVPVLYHGPFDLVEIESALIELERDGSVASPGFMNPEGICIYHTQTRGVFKVTLDNQDAGKWELTS